MLVPCRSRRQTRTTETGLRSGSQPDELSKHGRDNSPTDRLTATTLFHHSLAQFNPNLTAIQLWKICNYYCKSLWGPILANENSSRSIECFIGAYTGYINLKSSCVSSDNSIQLQFEKNKLFCWVSCAILLQLPWSNDSKIKVTMAPEVSENSIECYVANLWHHGEKNDVYEWGFHSSELVSIQDWIF